MIVLMLKVVMVMNADDDSDDRLRYHTMIDDDEEVGHDVDVDEKDDIGEDW